MSSGACGCLFWSEGGPSYVGTFVESGTGGGGRVWDRGISAECSVTEASRWVPPVGLGSGKVVFTVCCSSVELVFVGAVPSCRGSVVFVVVSSEFVSSVVGALFGVEAWFLACNHYSSYASASIRNNIWSSLKSSRSCSIVVVWDFAKAWNSSVRSS